MLARATSKAAILLFALVIILFLPGFPWSTHTHHKFKKLVAKAQVMASKWQGYQPSLVSISGETGVPGARVQSLDSRSGWATLCDGEGKFILPDVLWYPNVVYDLVISADDNKGKIVRVSAPTSFPSSGVINAGRLELSSEYEEDLLEMPGIASFSYQYFDIPNRDYYRKIYDELTNGKTSDEEKISAVNDYVTTKLNYNEIQWDLGSPRRVLDHGSQFCGHLSAAMATVLAVAFPVRMIELMDGASPPNTHVVVEVFYSRDWHLFDPTFGVKFKNKEGRVVSYRELRLVPELVSLDLFSHFREKYPKVPLNPLMAVYTSGHHHLYYLAYRCSQYAHAWWAYRNGLNYVPVGGRIILAAAGIRPGTDVTYHIRKPGSDQDELVFSSRRGGNCGCVLDEEESPPINVASGLYEVFVDLQDGNVAAPNNDVSASITNAHIGVKLEVR